MNFTRKVYARCTYRACAPVAGEEHDTVEIFRMKNHVLSTRLTHTHTRQVAAAMRPFAISTAAACFNITPRGAECPENRFFLGGDIWTGVLQIETVNSCHIMQPENRVSCNSSSFAFGALTLLVGRQEEHPPCKNWVIRCWRGYLSGARCRLFVYGPADATSIPKPHNLLRHLNLDWFYPSGISLSRSCWKRGR